jgi:hypothetical protein
MDPHERAVSVWYRTAGLASRNEKDLAVEIIEAEIRSAQYMRYGSRRPSFTPALTREGLRTGSTTIPAFTVRRAPRECPMRTRRGALTERTARPL